MMESNGKVNGWYGAEVWDQIKAEWLAGQLCLSDISRNYGPSRSTIRAKAKRFNWPPRGALAGEVGQEIDPQLSDEQGTPAGAPPPQADQIIGTPLVALGDLLPRPPIASLIAS
jgi:hypothetical protein